MTAIVAIIGRPNVGKSTLFNRLVAKRLALVDDQPGVTRDWREGEARLYDLTFAVLDTAGLEAGEAADTLEARAQGQTERAVARADCVLFVIDARAGVTPLDRHFATWLRKSPRPVLLVANKCEGRAGEGGLAEAFGLGLGEPIPLSAEHGLGLSDLHDALSALFLEQALTPGGEEAAGAEGGQDEVMDEEQAGPLSLAIVGRPNVGKSTLVNALLGEERMLTGPEPGITRDAISLDWSWEGRPVRLVDTAGLRRRARVTERVERLSVADTKRAIDLAQVVVLLLDSLMPMEKQDLTIARQVIDEGRALVVALNKWDLCTDRQRVLKALQERLERSLPQIRGISVVPLSALRKTNLRRLMAAVFAAYEIWNRRIPTAALNRWLEARSSSHPPPMVAGRRVRLKYATQAKARPPTIVLFCSRPDGVPNSYLRYLENSLREDFDLPGTPIRIHLRRGENPYA